MNPRRHINRRRHPRPGGAVAPEVAGLEHHLRAGALAARALPQAEAHPWQPAMNVYRCENHYVVCLELAGIDREAVRVLVRPRQLVISGRRLAPELPGGDAPQLIAGEISCGFFERIVVFPLEVDLTTIAAGHASGLVWIQLPLLATA